MPSAIRKLTTLLSLLLFNMICGLQSSFPPRNTKVGLLVSSRTDTASSKHIDAKIDTIDPTLREILQYTIMAPSSHNTQCWKFQVEDSRCVKLVPDMDRACPVVDPDDHHLYVTLGCAVENFVIAARAFGFETQVKLETPVQSKGIRLQLSPCPHEDSDLFQVIPKRQVTRCEYDGTSLNPEELAELQAAGTSTCPGVSMILKTKQGDDDCIGRIQDLILQANTEQLSNPDFKQELASWVRFNDHEAAEKGDGLLGKCTGNPSAPRWVGNLILQHIVRPSSENAKIKKQMASSAGIAIFVSTQNDPVHWIEVGRCYERFALKATAMGIKNAFLNQPVEEPQFRKLLLKELGLEVENNMRPDLLVRFGRGPTMPYSPRRPLEDVIAFQED